MCEPHYRERRVGGSVPAESLDLRPAPEIIPHALLHGPVLVRRDADTRIPQDLHPVAPYAADEHGIHIPQPDDRSRDGHAGTFGSIGELVDYDMKIQCIWVYEEEEGRMAEIVGHERVERLALRDDEQHRSTVLTILSMIPAKAFADSDDGSLSTIGMPESPESTIPGSIGTLPRNCTFISPAVASPPPDPNMSVTSPQWGHTNPLMFSTIPMIGIPVSAAKTRDFLLSSNATSCGVVTMTIPSALGISCTMDNASSPVPGGMSMTR